MSHTMWLEGHEAIISLDRVSRCKITELAVVSAGDNLAADDRQFRDYVLETVLRDRKRVVAEDH